MAKKMADENIVNQEEDTPVREFEVGDLAVYPAYGVCKIEAVEKRVINNETHDFFIMKGIENGMVIMIPVKNIKASGLREIIPENQISKVYEVMSKKNDPNEDTQTWNRRYREYMDKIKTGSLFDVAEVFRDLFLLRLEKDLSFGERKLFDQASSLLLKELSTAKNTDEATIMSEIESLFEVVPQIEDENA